jgi:hypothetical protein
MLVDRYLPALRQAKAARVARRASHASRGERVMGSLFPGRGLGWPGGWSEDRVAQVAHMTNWVYCAIDTICCKVAAISPNLAYVSTEERPGVTEKAGYRSLHASSKYLVGRYGGTAFLEDYPIGQGRAYDLQRVLPSPRGLSGHTIGFSEGGHSWLTMGAYRSKALSVVKPYEELEPLEHGHPLRRLIDNPNPYDTAFDLEYELQMFEELTGVSFEWLVPNRFGMPCERWCLPSHWVWPRTGGGRGVDPNDPAAGRLIWYYEVRPWGGAYGMSGVLRIPADEIVMTRWKSPLDKIGGHAKTAAIAQWIDSEESVGRSRWAQFMNVARPEFWVQLGPGYEDPDDDRIARIEAKFASKYQGEYNYGKPIITPPGSVLTPLSFNPTEMSYMGSEEQLRDMILSAWRVPPAAVGIVKEMTYGSILATLGSLCSFCINPRLAMRGQVRTKHLASRWDEPDGPSWSQGYSLTEEGKAVGETVTKTGGYGGRGVGRRVRLWYDDCVPADPDQVNSDIQVDLAGNAITPNEIRALRGRRGYRKGGDDPIVQGPGGPMPLPLNTGEAADLEGLAELIAPMTQAGKGEGQGEQGGGPAGPLGQGPGAEPLPDSPEGQLPGEEGTENATGLEPPEEPNGPPGKGWRVRKAAGRYAEGTSPEYDADPTLVVLATDFLEKANGEEGPGEGR